MIRKEKKYYKIKKNNEETIKWEKMIKMKKKWENSEKMWE